MSLKLCRLCLFYLLFSIAVRWSNGQVTECIDTMDDFTTNHWDLPSQGFYADTSADLPLIFHGRLVKGVFGIEGQYAGGNQEFTKDPSFITEDPQTFLYVKYYGHFDGSIPDQKAAYVIPGSDPTDPMEKLTITSDFQWREVLIRIDTINFPGFGLIIGEYGLAAGEYFFVDKIIISQGMPITTIEEIKILCTWEATTTTTTTITTTTAESTTTECINTMDHFTTNHWEIPTQGFYAETSADLPAIFHGKLEGDGIFYFEGEDAGSSHDFTKDPSFITEDPLTFLYLKYYVHFDGSNQKAAYVMPGPDGHDPMKILPVTSDFQWQEALVNIGTINFPGFGLIIGEYGLAAGEYFLVDKIIVAEGKHFTIEEIKASCPTNPNPTTETPSERPPTCPPCECVCNGGNSLPTENLYRKI